MASPPTTLPPTAPAHPGTATSRRSRSPTCSPRCGVPCWPPNIAMVTLTSTPSTYSQMCCSPSSSPPHNPETRGDLQATDLDAVVAAVAGVVGEGDLAPGQGLELLLQRGLVAFDDQQVGGVLWVTSQSACSRWVWMASYAEVV